MFPGIADRMQKELMALAPSSMKVSFTGLCCHRHQLMLLLQGQDYCSSRA